MISQLVVHIFDLVEAEGHALRTAVRAEASRAHGTVVNLVLGAGVVLVAAVLCAAGIGMLAASVLWWLEPHVGRPLATFICGVLVLLVATGGIFLFRFIVNRRDA